MHAASIILLAWAMIGAACFFPAAAAIPIGVVLALLVAVVGLPHGAADHRFARPRLEPLLGTAWAGVFLAGYLAVAVVVVGAWFLAPAATILVFFTASAWHFGQEEPNPAIGLGRPGARSARFARFFRPVYRLARGGLVIWVPLTFQSDEVVQILSLTAPRGFGADVQSAIETLRACSLVMLAIAAVGWSLQAVTAVVRGGRSGRALLVDNLLIASLVVLFAVANPIIGFLVYFCGWHSVRGLQRLRREQGESWSRLAVSLAPMTALAIGLFALATCLVLRAPNWNDTLIRATFIGLSSVALPHLLLHGIAPAIEQVRRRRASRLLEWGGAA